MKKVIMGTFLLGLMGCATTGYQNFPQVKEGMLKDEVLELVGSPNRSEYRESQDHWHYKYYDGPEKNREVLKKITFRDGVVTAVGDDVSELQRRKDIENDIANRARMRQERVKKREAAALNPQPAEEAIPMKPKYQSSDIDDSELPEVDKESKFVEIPGSNKPIQKEE